MMFLFDLDGTLVDSLDDLMDAAEHALKTMGYPGHSKESYRYFVGNGVKKLLERAFGTEDALIYKQARSLFDEYYWEHCLDHTVAYPGIKALIDQLNKENHVLGVITNKPDALAKKICDGLFGNGLNFVQGQVDSVPAKPNPYFVLNAMQAYQMDREKTIFIGDSNVDIITGKNAGVKTVGVTWGNRTRDELQEAGASYIVNDAETLKKLLEELTI